MMWIDIITTSHVGSVQSLCLWLMKHSHQLIIYWYNIHVRPNMNSDQGPFYNNHTSKRVSQTIHIIANRYKLSLMDIQWTHSMSWIQDNTIISMITSRAYSQHNIRIVVARSRRNTYNIRIKHTKHVPKTHTPAWSSMLTVTSLGNAHADAGPAHLSRILSTSHSLSLWSPRMYGPTHRMHPMPSEWSHALPYADSGKDGCGLGDCNMRPSLFFLGHHVMWTNVLNESLPH
jgi:hypothetical protein